MSQHFSCAAKQWHAFVFGLAAFAVAWSETSHRSTGQDASGGQTVEMIFVDLQPKANQKLKEPFHGSTDANNLAELKQDKQTLAGLRFKIGEALIQLANENLQGQYPVKAE